MQSRRTVWRRRVVVMVAVAIAVAVPVTLIIRSGGDDEPAAPDRDLTEQVRDRGIGFRAALPDGWWRSKRQGVLRLRNRDRTVGMTIAAPGPVDDVDEIFDTARDVIGEKYRRVATRRRFRARLGGRPARTAVFTALDAEHGTPLIIDAVVAEGRRRAYLVEVFTDARSGAGARAEAEAVLRGLRFTK
jgi:hypothetical protein